MKTGLLGKEDNNADEQYRQMMRKIVALMKVLMTSAMKTAERFVHTCGRNIITAADMKLALKYEAHEFLRRDFDEEFFKNLREEEQHTYETDENSEEEEEDEDDEESGESEEEEGEEEGEEGEEENGNADNMPHVGTVVSNAVIEEYTIECTASDVYSMTFHKKVIEYDDTWDSWNPDDQCAQLLKRSIDNITC